MFLLCLLLAKQDSKGLYRIFFKTRQKSHCDNKTRRVANPGALTDRRPWPQGTFSPTKPASKSSSLVMVSSPPPSLPPSAAFYMAACHLCAPLNPLLREGGGVGINSPLPTMIPSSGCLLWPALDPPPPHPPVQDLWKCTGGCFGCLCSGGEGEEVPSAWAEWPGIGSGRRSRRPAGAHS